jgi:hypothetical protein
VDKSDVIRQICAEISVDNLPDATAMLKLHYPFAPQKRVIRQYTPKQMADTFVRDGFIDRYQGTRLIFPPVLRVISEFIPSEFPYHPHGKMTFGHMAYWELFPTIDHVIPVARGGTDSKDNWATCSMLTNSIKAGWTLEELGWKLQPPGDASVWDGMFRWFILHVESNNALLKVPYIRRWHSAAVQCGVV